MTGSRQLLQLGKQIVGDKCPHFMTIRITKRMQHAIVAADENNCLIDFDICFMGRSKWISTVMDHFWTGMKKVTHDPGATFADRSIPVLVINIVAPQVVD